MLSVSNFLASNGFERHSILWRRSGGTYALLTCKGIRSHARHQPEQYRKITGSTTEGNDANPLGTYSDVLPKHSYVQYLFDSPTCPPKRLGPLYLEPARAAARELSRVLNDSQMLPFGQRQGLRDRIVLLSGLSARDLRDVRNGGRRAVESAIRLAKVALYYAPGPRLVVSPPLRAPEPLASPPQPVPSARQVLTIEWNQPEAWCSEDATYDGTTEGYAAGDTLDVLFQEQKEGGKDVHKASLQLSSSSFSGKWQVKDVLPPKTDEHFVRELKLDADAGGQRTPTPLLVKFAPTAKEVSHTHQGKHTFGVSALDYEVAVKSNIKFVPGWGASVVKLGSKVPKTTGGLLDGKLAWKGYRWMKSVGLKYKFWDGEAWQSLPEKFRLIDANNFCVGFYKKGAAFVCQHGGTWPDKFTLWDIKAPAKAKKIKDWTREINTTWNGKFDLKNGDCKSDNKECCRYKLKVEAKFTKQAQLSKGVIIIADGDIRSNDSLFFIGDTRLAMVAHEFGHHIGNPDEYGGAKVDETLNTDGAKKGIDRNSIMGQNMTTVKARHFTLLAKVLGDAIEAEYGKKFAFKAVKP